MFATLTEELLDLTATERGVGLAAYASADDPGGCGGCSSVCSIIVCCFLCRICW